MRVLDFVKQQKVIFWIMCSFLCVILVLFFSALAFVFAITLLTGGAVNSSVVVISLIPGICAGILGIFAYKRNYYSFLSLPLRLDAGSVYIKNTQKFPIKVTVGLGILRRRDAGRGRVMYVCSTGWVNRKKEITVEPGGEYKLEYPQGEPLPIYKDLIDTVKFAGCEISDGGRNLWIAWFGPYMALFADTKVRECMRPIYRKLVGLAKELGRESEPSEKEMEEWLNNF